MALAAGLVSLILISRRCKRTRGDQRLPGGRPRAVTSSSGRLRGLQYRLRRQHPEENVSDLVLADRIRSSIGPLERRLDLPHVHVMVHDHIVMLHGDVSCASDAKSLIDAVHAISGVRGVESYLHMGLLPSDTRPSDGRARPSPPSNALSALLDAAREAGSRDAPLFAVHAVLATFLDRIPADERSHVFAHLPADVRLIVGPPLHAGDQRAQVNSIDDVYAAVAAADPRLDKTEAGEVSMAVLGVLRELVPEERDDIAAVLPHDIRDMWKDLRTATAEETG